jgi:spermidine synthase
LRRLRAEVREEGAAVATVRSVALLLTILTGFSGLVYQVAWQKVLATLLGSHSEATCAVLGIFLGGLALGASQFTFAMVVATFVLCIALGSFAVSALRRIRPAYLPLSQWGVVAYLLALYASVENAPYWTRVLLQRFEDAAEFYPFYGAVFLWILAVVLLPLALSGALLPLLFHHLRHETADLGDTAGRLYGWNTVGSLLGALVGGYLLLFWVDLHIAYRIAVLALAAAAAILTLRIVRRGWIPAAAGLAPGLEPRVLARLSALFGPDATAAMAPSWELARNLARVF